MSWRLGTDKFIFLA